MVKYCSGRYAWSANSADVAEKGGGESCCKKSAPGNLPEYALFFGGCNTFSSVPSSRHETWQFQTCQESAGDAKMKLRICVGSEDRGSYCPIV